MATEPTEKNSQLPPWAFERFPHLTSFWQRTPNWFHQAVRFGMVGLLNTAVDLGSYWLLTRLVPIFADQHVPAKAISYTLGVINSYIWNRRFTFRSKVSTTSRFILFFVINLIAVGINSGLMALALNILHLPEWVGLLAATVITMSWNFLTSKFIVFRDKPDQTSA